MARPDVRGPIGPGPDDGFEREAELVRSLATDPVELVDAPDGLWDRIAAAAEAGTDESPEPPRADADLDRRAGGSGLVVHDGDRGSDGVVTPISHGGRRRWRTALVGAAAAIVVLAVGAGVVVATRSSDGPTEVAAAELTPFDGAQVGDAGGRVELIEDGDQVRLRVDMHDLPAPAPGTFYELWLLDPASGEPVSIATMKDGSSSVATALDVPPGTDTARFDVVDVSVQEESAGPEHSGNSVLRGTLSA